MKQLNTVGGGAGHGAESFLTPAVKLKNNCITFQLWPKALQVALSIATQRLPLNVIKMQLGCSSSA